MSFFGPNAQKRYFPQQPASYSTTSLIQSKPSFNSPKKTQSSHSLRNNSPYEHGVGKSASLESSISDKFSLSPDPAAWGANLSPDFEEPDDYLHNPDPRRDRKNDRHRNVFTYRGITNLGCLIILCVGLVALL
ncbi:hypothetical protein BJ165DRAFT_531260 [Panaeolus papilionaceus]|nr:hypothetical protein BJ165DRAFT_531260 [Panaeolus papilionaceus]